MTKALQNVWIESSQGYGLAGVVHFPAISGRTGVVICHGMLSGKDSPKLTDIAHRLCALGHAVLRFDFSGRGESQGNLMQLTFRRQVKECKAAMDALRARGFERLGLVGSSMGGAVAILTAASEKVMGLVTLAAIGHAERLAERAVGKKGVAAWKREGSITLEKERVGWSLVEDAYTIDIPGAACRVGCPWLILHGQFDEVIPVSEAQALQTVTKGRAILEVIPNADHRFSKDKHREQVAVRVVDFLHEILSVDRDWFATYQNS